MDFFEARKGSFEAVYFQNPEEAYRPVWWLANTAYPKNSIVWPTTYTGRSYKASTGGTSHATTQPTWPTSIIWPISTNGAASGDGAR